ncbi:helix-turn-helix transcriptional regulator [Saccharopolyspora sp. NFXS83]|uniref:helix-turn-helix domain-containing protein n=1 Tax=Saccharopolyspora sp. NFXS83 TaxID=2993560 RepID=UPI00224B671A|nr:helix-turn-helix transcriptional regulator [Saccharopolyspora sp. NFXS83]MCX2730850.1 helix-turn-helix transcriptional regulator [Saccharopolyspora sp. NFXS83]
MAPASPLVAAWELGIRLKAAREQVDMTGTDAAHSIGVTQNYLSNIEHGRRKIAEDKLTALAGTYLLDDDEAAELVELRKASDGRGWWSRYSGLFAPELLRYFGFEHGAEEIRSYESGVMSGLLQTRDYAHAVHSGDRANLRGSEIDRRVEARQMRQHRISGSDPLRAVIVLTEGVLRQQVGGREVLSGQLEHVLNMIHAHSDTLAIRIIPFSAGSYGAMGSSTFHLLTFPSPRLRRLAWHEAVTSLNLIDTEARVHQYSLSFDEALDRAADVEASEEIIRDALRSIT